MKYIVFKNRIMVYIGEDTPSGLLTDEQASFHEAHPDASVSEVLSLKLKDPVEELSKFKGICRHEIDSLIKKRINELMPYDTLMVAYTVKALGKDGQITLQVANDRINYFAKVSKQLNDYKMQLYLSLEFCEDSNSMEQVVNGINLQNFKIE